MKTTELKAKFQTGDIPTQQDFSDFINFAYRGQSLRIFVADGNLATPTYNYICTLADINMGGGVVNEIPIQIIEIQINPDDPLLYAWTYVLKTSADGNIQNLVDLWQQYAYVDAGDGKIFEIENNHQFKSILAGFFKQVQQK